MAVVIARFERKPFSYEMLRRVSAVDKLYAENRKKEKIASYMLGF